MEVSEHGTFEELVKGVSVDWGALLGGLIGAGVPAALGYLGWRRARQSNDAEAFGPAMLLLDLLQPDRVSFNVSSDQEADAAKWVYLTQQAQTARERLLIVSAGHPRRQVRDLAREAQIQLANVCQASGWQAADIVEHRSDPEWRRHALQKHAEAEATMRKLIDAHFRWFGRR